MARLRPPRFVQAPPGSFLAATSLTIPLAFAADVTAGSLIICRVNWGLTTTTCTVADSRGNAWSTAVAKFTNANLVESMQVFYCFAKDSGPMTVTATFAATSTNRYIEVMEYAGMAAVSPNASANGSSAAIGTALSTAAVALGGQAGFYTQHCYVGGSVTAFGGGFTRRQSGGGDDGGDLLNQAPGASVAGAATQTPSAHWMMTCIAWKYAGPPDIPALAAPSLAVDQSVTW